MVCNFLLPDLTFDDISSDKLWAAPAIIPFKKERKCLLENIRQEIYALEWNASFALATQLTNRCQLCVFLLQSQLLNLADKLDLYSLLLQILSH